MNHEKRATKFHSTRTRNTNFHSTRNRNTDFHSTRNEILTLTQLAIEMEKRKVAGCLDPITRQLITFDDDEDLE